MNYSEVKLTKVPRIW